MFSLRTHAIICGALFATLFGIAILGNILQAAGMKPLGGQTSIVAMVLFFGLFVAAGLSAIPVIVKVVLGAQVKLGNQSAPVIGGMIRTQNAIIWTMWGLIIAGLAVAMPFAIADGFFGAAPQAAVNAALEGPDLGRLSARPDMTLAEMTRQSTMTLDLRYASAAIAGGGVFDFAIPGTQIAFEHARTYYMNVYDKDPKRLRSIVIGTSPHKVSLAELHEEDAELRAKLVADGWLAGHEVYRDAEDQALHRGLTQGPEGTEWLKDGMMLSIESKRMDDEVAGEDPKTAGEWIQMIELWPKKEFPWIERYVFQPPGRQK